MVPPMSFLYIFAFSLQIRTSDFQSKVLSFENTKKKKVFSLHFAHLFVPLIFNRRYFRSKILRKKRFFLCILLTYSYLCKQFRNY